MNSDPLLRAATIGDLDEIWAIESDVFGAEAWSREMMREELEADHRTYLALVGEHDEVLGYGGLLSVGTEGDIQTIALKPGVRGSGQGRRLMTSLLDAADAAGVREVFLEVRADNSIAQSLYLSLGFESIGVRPGYYQPDNVDAVVMKALLGSRGAAVGVDSGFGEQAEVDESAAVRATSEAEKSGEMSPTEMKELR